MRPHLTSLQPGRRSRWLARAVLAAVSGGLCFGVGEWVWRRSSRAHYRQQLAAFAEPMYALADGPERYRLRPNLDVTQTFPHPTGGSPTVARYRTDADGLRQPVPAADAPGKRLLFVGDSYTFGIGVADDEPFAARSAARLQQLGVVATAWNAGVPGHDSEQTLAILRAALPRVRPHHVVLGFVMNDAEPPTYVPLPPAVRHAGAWSWLARDARALGNVLACACIDDHPPWPEQEWNYEFDYRASWTAGSPKAARSLAAVAAMHAACRDAGAGFTVAILPDFTRAFDATYPYGSIHAQVAAFGTRHGIATLDLFDAVRGAEFTDLQVPSDGHPNAAGHLRLATRLAECLAAVLR